MIIENQYQSLVSASFRKKDLDQWQGKENVSEGRVEKRT